MNKETQRKDGEHVGVPNRSSFVVGSADLRPLDIRSNNMSITWKNWITQLKIYLRANNLENETDSRKVAILLHFIGTESLVIFYSFGVDIDMITFEDLIKRFTDHFTPQINVTMERHKLFNRRQGPDESIDDYVTDLKNISKQCLFEKLEDSITRDIFSWNLNSKNQLTKERILCKKPTTLQEAVQLAKNIELTRTQAKALEDTAFVGQVTRRQSRLQSAASSRQVGNRRHSSISRQSSSSRPDTCNRCGQFHRFKCPAKGVKCKKCGKYNHFAALCRSKQVHNIELTSQQSSQSNNNFFMGSIHINSLETKSWQASLSINNKQIIFLLDTGADTNVLTSRTFHKLELSFELISKSKHTLSTFSGETIPTLGQCFLPLYYKGQIYNVLFHIVDINSQNILGREMCQKLNLIKRVNTVKFNVNETIFDTYNDLFQGLGCIKDYICDLKLKPDAVPSIDACRRVPFKLRNILKEELDNLEHNNIICKVEEPTEWVSSIVLTTKKNGKIRLCIDPRKLNQAIMRSHYQFPTFEEIKSDLAGAKYFSTLDANKGFWMLKLSESSSKLCTFITPFGRYRFTRLPFGINAAPEIFHREMVKRFNDINNVKIMMDDFLIYGKTIEEHNDTLHKVLQRAQEINLKFNKEKSVICASEVKYLGHVFTQNGVQVDKAKVKAICDMPKPTCLNDLQRFMGMVNYLSSFIPNLSNENSLLRTLLSKQNEWSWSEHHDAEFNKIKTLISQAPVLTYFDPNKDITMSVDASKDALGAVIMHEKQPIAYASASLTKCQQNYSQIEKELMSILFGCTKFHQYIYGRTVTVETDHKPLISLFKKALFDIPARLQRIMLRLQPYDLIVIYKPGRYLFIADTLSRAPLSENTLEDLSNDIDLHINFVMTSLPASDEKLNDIKNLTYKDSTLSQIINYCQFGWPEHKRSVNQTIKPYFSLKDKLHVINNILFMLDKIVIPESMREYVINIAHQGHQGINSCIRLAKTYVYWPNISNDIEKFINQCHTCLTYRRNNSKEPILHHEYKLLPWNKVGVDIFDFDGKKYLMVVDYYSKYVELALLNTGSNAKIIINHLKSIFAKHGIPEYMITDNGPPFSSKEFMLFATDWKIKLNSSSPYMSRSNGMVERTIGTIKQMLKKCKSDNSDPYLALLVYRNTPKKTGFSPAQLCMSRNLRTKLPVTDSQLMPTVVDTNLLKKNIEKHRSYTTLYYNKHSKPLSELQKGDKVYFKHKPFGEWVPGRISDACSEPRSYIVQSPQGEFRRNRQHILKPVIPATEIIPETEKLSDKIENYNANTCNNNDTQTPLKMSRFGRVIKPPARYNCD